MNLIPPAFERLAIETPEEFAAKVTTLVKGFIDLDEQIVECQIAIDNHHDQKPQFAPIVTDLLEYARMVKLATEWQSEYEKLVEQKELLTVAKQKLEMEIQSVLPSEVWFKVDEWAVGIVCSSWGGIHYYVTFKLWSENLSPEDLTRKS